MKFSLFNKKISEINHQKIFEKQEMEKFYLVLLKIKNRRPSFNVNRVMKMLYGKKFEEEKFEN